MLKASVNNRLDLAFLAKFPISGLEDIASFSGGIGITGLGDKEPKIESGIEIGINL